jgi:hypothetical protein
MGSERNELNALAEKMKREKEELYCEGCKGEKCVHFLEELLIEAMCS